MARIHITSGLFPAPNAPIPVLATFAMALRDAAECAGGEVKLRAYRPTIDCPSCIEIEARINSSGECNLVAHGQVWPGLSRIKPAPARLSVTLPREVTIQIANSLETWCQEPTSKLTLPLRVDA